MSKVFFIRKSEKERKYRFEYLNYINIGNLIV